MNKTPHLKVDLQKGVIETQGSVMEMSASVLFVIETIYTNLLRHDKVLAYGFKEFIVGGVTHPASPVFAGRDDDSESILVNLDAMNGRR